MTADIIPQLRRNPRLVTRVMDPTGSMAIWRPNHTQPPFDNPAIRRAMLGAMDQAKFMQAAAGYAVEVVINVNPAAHLPIRGNGDAAWSGWAVSPRLEALRNDRFAAPDLAARQTVAKQMQLQAGQDVPYIALGQISARPRSARR